MVEVNEEITRAYFEEVCGYMVRTGYHFTKSSQKRAGKARGGAGPADIDLLIYHPNPKSELFNDYIKKYGVKAMVSVKGWHMLPKKSRKLETALETIDNACKSTFGDHQASDAARVFFGDSGFNRILVLSRIDNKFPEEQRKYAKTKYQVNSIIEFSDMLRELLSAVQNRRYFPESQILQTMYTLNEYILNEKHPRADQRNIY